MQTRTRNLIISAAVVGVVAAGGAGVAIAGSAGSDVDTPITGPALDRASAAALEHLGEGRVTDTEEGDEDSWYEVEVTLDDGTEVDVQLDEDFKVVDASPEDGPDDDDE